MRAVVRVVAAALAVAVVAGSAWAQGGFGKSGHSGEKPNVAKKEIGSKRDPVADAFILPKGVVLRSDQQEKFGKLKQEMEPKLRDALAEVETATGAEKSNANRAAALLRKEIKNKIAEILQQPDPVAVKAAQDAARAAQQARFQNRAQGKAPGKKRR